MTSNDVCESSTEDLVVIGQSESIQSTALDGFVEVHLSAKTTGNGLPPSLPFRSRLNARKEVVRKARAPSPAADVRESEGVNCDDFTSPPPPPPPIPPRLPPRINHSSKYNQRFPGRPVYSPKLSQDFLFSTPLGLQPSGSELLQSRPPPPPPPSPPLRDADIADILPVLTLQPTAITSCKSPPLSDADLVWWPPSGEQQSSPLHQLTHWPISSLSALTGVDQSSTGSRKMNDYVDSPIALCSNVVNISEAMENSVNSEISDSSLDRHLWSMPSFTAVESSTKVKSSRERNTETVTDSQQRIMCEHCGKCRCNHCTNTRPLPRCWAGECECSAQSVIDCCTCMCCARALFYHCRTTEDNDYSDNPCACTEQRDCCKRWTLLTLLSFCLPCLCLYYPLDCALRLCTVCYNRRHSTGCCVCEDEKCRTEATKGLLIESESSSS